MPKFSADSFHVQIWPSTVVGFYHVLSFKELFYFVKPHYRPKLWQIICNFNDIWFKYKHSDSRLRIPDWWVGTGFLRVIWCLNSISYRMTLMRKMVSWLLVHLAIISRDDYVIMILLCCFDFSGRHIVPRSLWSPHVHSQHRKDNTWGPARAWRLIWIAKHSPTLSVATSREGRLNGGPL